MVDATELASGT
jgi:hypothetical protein